MIFWKDYKYNNKQPGLQSRLLIKHSDVIQNAPNKHIVSHQNTRFNATGVLFVPIF